uniref:Uncharacterized protein n=1 Tax=Triticum urartu TaxID=4572 RepID=A0A8R7QSN9_TRIUA
MHHISYMQVENSGKHPRTSSTKRCCLDRMFCMANPIRKLQANNEMSLVIISNFYPVTKMHKENQTLLANCHRSTESRTAWALAWERRLAARKDRRCRYVTVREKK